MKIHTNTQQINLLTVLHEAYLLHIKWKWIIIEYFILIVFTMSKLKRKRKGRVDVADSGVHSWRRRKGRQVE